MHKRIAYILISLVLAILSSAGCSKKRTEGGDAAKAPTAAPEAYNTFKAMDGSFTIDLPIPYKTMKLETHELTTALGKQSLNMYLLETKDVFFMASQMNLQMPKGKKFDVQNGLKGGFQGMVGGYPLLTPATSIQMDGYPAMTARVKKTDEGKDVFVEFVEIYAEDNQFQLQVLTYDQRNLSAPEAQHFIQSFKYTGPKTAKPSS